MAKKREPDNLVKDAARALAAGMSYGKWKAFHPNTKGGEIPVIKIETTPCKNCGKPMQIPKKGSGRRSKKYCSPECAYIARCIRENEKKRERRRQNGECV